jgi:hypothetical protein
MDTLTAPLGAAASAVHDLVGAGLEPESLRAALIALQAHLDAVTVVQARLIDQATRQRAWEGTGARDMAEWLAGATRSSYGSAKKKARLGSTLRKNTKLSEAVGKGEISPDAAGELSDLFSLPPDNATDDDLNDLVEAVKGASPRDTRDAAARLREILSSESEEEAADRRYRQRSVTSTVPIDGMVTTSVTLPTLEARMFLNAINHAAGRPVDGDRRSESQRLADGVVVLADAYSKGAVTGGREKPTILITMSLESLLGASNEPARTAQGDHVPAFIARRLAEHAHLQRVVMAGNAVVNMGRTVRCATDDQYRALAARDGGCRFPGCHAPASWCDVDHLQPWEAGGPTDLNLLVLWCRHHHTERHRPGVRVEGDAHELRLHLADGRIVDCPPRTGRPRQAAA